MKIVFVFERLSENKFFAPIIQLALERAYTVELWVNHQDISKTTKWYEFPAVEKFPAFHPTRKPDFKIFRTREELARLSNESNAKVIFAWLPPEHQRPPGQLWFHIVTSLWDSTTAVQPEMLDRFDHIFYATPHWSEVTLHYYRITGQLSPDSELARRLRRKACAVGSPQFDQYRFCDRRAIREKLGIPPEARVVLLFAFECPAGFWPTRIFLEPSLLKRLWSVLIMPFSYPYVFSKVGKAKIFRLFLRSLWHRPIMLWEALVRKSQKDAILAIRSFCDRNGAFFLMKARKKRPLFDYDYESADLVIDEDKDYFPFTTAQLIVAADLAIACNSTAVAESVAGGLSVVNISAPRPHYVRDHHLLLRMHGAEEHGLADETVAYNPDPGGMYNFKGAVWNMPINQFVRDLPRSDWGDFAGDKAQKIKYVEKFIKETGEPVADTILDRAIGLAEGGKHDGK